MTSQHTMSPIATAGGVVVGGGPVEVGAGVVVVAGDVVGFNRQCVAPRPLA